MPEVAFTPRLTRAEEGTVGSGVIRLGHPLVDAYLEFVAARARANTLLAQAFDLKVFFSFVSKDPSDVTTTDVLAFINAQRQPRHGAKVVRIQDGERPCEKSRVGRFRHGQACLASRIQPMSPTQSGRSWSRCCRRLNGLGVRERTFAR
jgi:hypothetical protein